jgi:hypothetical protein
MLPLQVGNPCLMALEHEPREVFMLRAKMIGLLAVGAIAGCANLNYPARVNGYCLTGSGGGCSELEGSGDCQPCQTRNVNHLSANTLAQRLP